MRGHRRFGHLVPSIVLAGCAFGATAGMEAIPVRPASDVPETFVAASGSPAPDTCLSPLVDPRDGTEIRLVRSSAGVGDYSAARGRYGTAGGDLLRIDCATGRVMGIVAR